MYGPMLGIIPCVECFRIGNWELYLILSEYTSKRKILGIKLISLFSKCLNIDLGHFHLTGNILRRKICNKKV